MMDSSMSSRNIAINKHKLHKQRFKPNIVQSCTPGVHNLVFFITNDTSSPINLEQVSISPIKPTSSPYNCRSLYRPDNPNESLFIESDDEHANHAVLTTPPTSTNAGQIRFKSQQQ